MKRVTLGSRLEGQPGAGLCRECRVSRASVCWSDPQKPLARTSLSRGWKASGAVSLDGDRPQAELLESPAFPSTTPRQGAESRVLYILAEMIYRANDDSGISRAKQVF